MATLENATHVKDPDAEKPYSIDWSRFLSGDSIATSVWDLGGLTQGTPANTFDTKSSTVWVRGGAVGQAYNVRNRITTVGGQTDDGTLVIRVEQQ